MLIWPHLRSSRSNIWCHTPSSSYTKHPENKGFQIFCDNKWFSKTILWLFLQRYTFFLYLKTLTMRLCTLCKIVSMSKQYSGTVGLKTKINLATRYYIIKGSFKGQANRKPSGIFSGTSAASLIYHFLQENLNFSLWDDDVLFSLGSLHRHCTLGGVARKWPVTWV